MLALLSHVSLALALVASGPVAGIDEVTPTARPVWTADVVERFATLPIQDGGRVKPLDTYAQFSLLRFNGKRELTTEGGEELGPVPWLLDCLFFPEIARTYRTFLVRDDALLAEIGVRVEGRKKNDRYSYDELLPGREKLFSLAGRISGIEDKKRTGRESQLFALAINLRDFEELCEALEFTRADLGMVATPLLSSYFGADATAGITPFLAGVPALRETWEAKLAELPEDRQAAESAALEDVSRALSHTLEVSDSAFAIYPPPTPAEEEWLSVDAAATVAFTGASPDALALLASWEALERAKHDPPAFAAELERMHARVAGIAEARGEYSKVPLEVSFYRGKFFTRALACFLGAFVLLAFSWMAPRARWLVGGVWGLSLAGTGFVVAGVVLRCVIRARPPVTTLYETILFITGCIAIVLLAIEWIQRNRIALALTPILGAAGMFLAMKYELKEAAIARDTMPSLVAVLDTNFWLATHVTTITLGYAAGLLAAALGSLWMLGKMFGLKRGNKEFYRTISRMTYGVTCFGLIFSVIGTILGGVWANYSWGRFWGWDPKENGALLICIGQLLILHARMGGYIREHGLAALASIVGMVIAFSWWHVNLLGVGLHAYGKTEGVLQALFVYYGSGTLLLVGSLIWRLATQQAARPAPADSSTDLAGQAQ